MRNKTLFLAITIFPGSLLWGQTYITNVTVLDVEKQHLIPAQTVVITGNRITNIGASKKLKPTEGATIIEGKGKFLLPGLVDAHVHFFQSGGLYTRPDGIDLRKYVPYDTEIEWVHNNMEDFLRRYLASGITTVFDVGSTLRFLRQRDTFQNKVYSPAVYMTGPLITTWEPSVFKNLENDEPFFEAKTPEEARQLVQKQLPFKPDFIKIWYIAAIGNNLEATARKYLPVVQATIDEAHKNNLKVAVHATERITAQLAVESGCDYLVHFIDDEIVTDEFLQLLRRKHIVLCPTLIVSEGYIKTFAQNLSFSSSELLKSNPVPLGSLYDLKHLPDTNLVKKYKLMGEREQLPGKKTDSIKMVNLKKMVEAGITIASGTDAGNIGTQHATSYMKELKVMQESGMNNWQIVQASTINGAKALGKEQQFGSITTGKRADMILLNANPLDNLDNLEKLDLVINKGHVIKPDTLIKETALTLVQRQMNALNARNLNAFMEPYADDVELYTFPNKQIAKGKIEMSKMYASLFEKMPNLHCQIINRIVQGNIIIDNERITGLGDKPLESTGIFYIEEKKIRKVYFIQ